MVRRIPRPERATLSTGHTAISICATSPRDRASIEYVAPSPNLARKRGPVVEAGVPSTDHRIPFGSSETASSSTRSRGKNAVRFALTSMPWPDSRSRGGILAERLAHVTAATTENRPGDRTLRRRPIER